MKLLLTSGGLNNASIINALRELVGRDFKEARLAFIPTASNPVPGDKWWLIKDLVKCQELGFKEVDIVEIAAIPQNIWEPRLRNADVIMVGGGYTAYLMEQMRKSGLQQLLPELLLSRVYVGVSSGSMVTAPRFRDKESNLLLGEPDIDDDTHEGLNLVDFLVAPHVNSPNSPRAAELMAQLARNTGVPLYVIDDHTAVKVIDGKAEVVSEGKWERLG
jgi:dipeptidase E